MDQTEFKRALAKFERQKQKRAQQNLASLGGETKVNTALPFADIQPKPKKEKLPEAPRPRPLAMEVVVTGPVSLKFSIDWAGSLLGGQMNPQAMTVLFQKALSAMGRVQVK